MKRIKFLGTLTCVGMLACGMPVMAAPLSEDGLNVKLVQDGGILQNVNEKISTEKFAADGVNTLRVFPEKYDLRNVDGKSYVTPIKFQNPWGTCWAFSSIASLESSVIMQGAGTAEDVDYSEKAIVWYGGQLQKGENDTGKKEGVEYISADSSQVYNAGGRIFSASTQMSSWIGTSTEEQVPYQNKEETMESIFLNGKEVYYYDPLGDWTLDDTHLYDRAYQLKNTQYVCGYTDLVSGGLEEDDVNRYIQNNTIPQIKTLLTDRGAVAISFCADESSPDDVGNSTSSYFNEEHNAQYNPDRGQANHGVTIVGWDDNYSKENFSITPPGDGAWIVKNSWSDAWGDQGYFYLSYYDSTISEYESLEADVGSAGYSSYDHNYQYDYLGNKSIVNNSVESIVSNTLAKMDRDVKAANIFQAKGNETLRAVGLNDNICINENATIVTEIYKLKDNSNPENGELVSSQTDTISNLVYSTIELKQPVELKEGEYFSVVQSIYTASGLPGVPVEIGTSEPINVASYDGNTYQISYVANCEPGQSFLWGLNGLLEDKDEEQKWQDVTDDELQELFKIPVGTDESDGYTVLGNAMIKAYTVDTDTTLSMSNHKVDILCYDSSGTEIARLKNVDIGALPDLPWNTDSIAFALQEDNGDSLAVKLDSVLINGQEKISREKFENADAAELVLSGLDRGESANRTYPVSLTFEKQPETEPEDGSKDPTRPGDSAGGETTDVPEQGNKYEADDVSGTPHIQGKDEVQGEAVEASRTGDAGDAFAWGIFGVSAAALSVVLAIVRKRNCRLQ